MSALQRCIALGAALSLGACAASPPRGYVVRLEQLALIETLNADLLSHDSATLTLERWCAAHRMAEPAKIVALRDKSVQRELPADGREQLGLGADDAVRYRRVQLACGTHVLSEADNWYVPARLTPDMNRRLDESDEPFGKVVRALGFTRHTFAMQRLWPPLAAGWEMQPPDAREASAPQPPHAILQHRALLSDRDGRPFSLVVETYTSELFAFGH